jgi:hypothetical protein
VRRAALMAGLAAVLVAALCEGALAQHTEIEPAPAQRCIVTVDGASPLPEYPSLALSRRRSGRVLVELTFSDASSPPQVRVIQREGHPEDVGEFVEAVRAHARHLRTPCWTPGEPPSRIEREYAFEPDRSATFVSGELDPDAARVQRLVRCLSHETGAREPTYPRTAARDRVQGRVVLRLRFDAADRPPTVEAFARHYARPLVQRARSWATGYRLPCFDGKPVSFLRTYTFVFEGETYGFKPLTLLQLMRLAKGLEQERLHIDTSQMGCPFDLRFSPRQPMLPNGIAQVGGDDPRRLPLLRWLRDVQLNLNSEQLDAVFGDYVNVTVPCLTIDLKPKE